VSVWNAGGGCTYYGGFGDMAPNTQAPPVASLSSDSLHVILYSGSLETHFVRCCQSFL